MDAAGVSWRQTFPTLAETYRVYALDLLGYGESGPVPDDDTPHTEYYVDVITEALASITDRPRTLIGISKGGGIALGYTLAHPTIVENLCLVDSYGLGGDVPGGPLGAAYIKAPKLLEASWWLMKHSRTVTKQHLQNLLYPPNLTDALLEDVYRELQRRNSGEAYTRFRRAEINWTGLRTNYAHQLADLSANALFIHGQDDDLIPPAHSQAAAATAPHAEAVTIENCGHWPPRERHDAFHSHLTTWLDAATD